MIRLDEAVQMSCKLQTRALRVQIAESTVFAVSARLLTSPCTIKHNLTARAPVQSDMLFELMASNEKMNGKLVC